MAAAHRVLILDANMNPRLLIAALASCLATSIGFSGVAARAQDERRAMERLLEGQGQVQFSPDGTVLATGAVGMSAEIAIWDPLSGAQRALLTTGRRPRVPQSLVALGFDADGTCLGSVSFDAERGRPKVGSGIARFWDMRTRHFTREFRVESEDPELTKFSPALDRVAVAGSRGSVLVYNTATGKLMGDLRPLAKKALTPSLTTMSFSRDGATAACIYDFFSGEVPVATLLRLWDLAHAQERAEVPAPPESFECSVYSADGRTVAAADINGGIVLFDTISREVKLTLTDDTLRSATCIALTADNHFLAIGGNRAGAVVWDLERRVRVLKLVRAWRISSVAFHPKGRLLAAGSPAQSDDDRGFVAIWRVPD
jgi:WD40 repeat protein